MLWRNIAKLLGKGQYTSHDVKLKLDGIVQHDSAFLAMKFNEYFIDSVQKLTPSFSSLCYSSPRVCDVSDFSLVLKR